MRGWRRLGIVLSVVWFVGFGGWLWTREVDRISEFHIFQLTNCSHIDTWKRETIRGDDPQRNEKIAKTDTEYRACEDRAGDFFSRQMDQFRSNVWVLFVVDAGVLAVFWLVAWLIVVVGRWVAAGFRRQA